MADAVAALGAAIQLPCSTFSRTVQGTVTPDHVSLIVHTPLERSGMAPQFVGRFSATAEGSVLEGEFGVRWFARVFMAVWMLICVLFSAVALVLAWVEDPMLAFGALVGPALAVVGVYFVRMGAERSATDVSMMERVIRRALQLPVDDR